MSIVLLLRSLNVGGAERQAVVLAKGLHRRGHRVLVVVFYDGGTMLRDLHAAGVPVVVLHKRSRWDIIRFLHRLRIVLRHHRPQVVYAFLVEPSLVAVLMKPFVSSRVVWGVRASNVALAQYGWFPRLTWWVTTKVTRFADLTIANSLAGADHHRQAGYPADKMAVVPNGIDVERFRPDVTSRRAVRKDWGIGQNDIVVGHVARLDPMKDHVSFLEAAAILGQERPAMRFVCVGGGSASYRAELEARASALGLVDSVTWTGEMSDTAVAYNGMDVCCLTSASGEGFPNVLGEAMACGVPCVATDVGDAARIVDGCGEIVPVRDPIRLAEAIRRVLAAASPDRKHACRERIAREFSVDSMVERTEHLLLQCVNVPA